MGDTSVTSKLIIAAAGSGKTTYLVKKALEVDTNQKVLITTFTDANTEAIKYKILKFKKYLPNNIVIQPWFSFLLQHGVKPFQDINIGNTNIWDMNIRGVVLPEGQSGVIIRDGKIIQFAETNIAHYFTAENYIYTDKLSKLAVKCNIDNQIILRLSKIFSHIFIDEIQDLSGYDLDFLKLLIESNINIIMVGDPRQTTYSTGNVSRNRQYRNGNIKKFIKDARLPIEIDESSLLINYRCCEDICCFSNNFYPAPNWPQTISGNDYPHEHKGIYLVKEVNRNYYLKKYCPVQLRWDIKKACHPDFPAFNLGEAKGLEFDHVVIYPTQPFLHWLKNNSFSLSPSAKAKFYVGITRAKYSVGIITDQNIPGLQKWENDI